MSKKTEDSLSLPLSALAPGETATVTDICMTGAMRRRLADIGLIPGTPVFCLGRSPLGDPSAYRIRGAVIALRASDCREILLTR